MDFYVLSLKHSRREHGVLMWWGPDNKNYVFRLPEAGRYSDASIRAERAYYCNGWSTLALPCDVVDAMAVAVGDVKSNAIDRDRPATDHVVRYDRLRALRAAAVVALTVLAPEEPRS